MNLHSLLPLCYYNTTKTPKTQDCQYSDGRVIIISQQKGRKETTLE